MSDQTTHPRVCKVTIRKGVILTKPKNIVPNELAAAAPLSVSPEASSVTDGGVSDQSEDASSVCSTSTVVESGWLGIWNRGPRKVRRGTSIRKTFDKEWIEDIALNNNIYYHLWTRYCDMEQTLDTLRDMRILATEVFRREGLTIDGEAVTTKLGGLIDGEKLTMHLLHLLVERMIQAIAADTANRAAMVLLENRPQAYVVGAIRGGNIPGWWARSGMKTTEALRGFFGFSRPIARH